MGSGSYVRLGETEPVLLGLCHSYPPGLGPIAQVLGDGGEQMVESFCSLDFVLPVLFALWWY